MVVLSRWLISLERIILKLASDLIVSRGLGDVYKRQAWRKSAMNEAYAVGELGKYYLSDDRGMSWMAIETGYEGSYWAGIKVDEGQSLLLGMSGNLTLINDYGAEDIIPSDKITTLACYESGIYAGECKTLAFERLFIGSKNSLTNAIILDDGRIAISGNGGSVSVVDLFRKNNIETCVRSDRVSWARRCV